MKRSEKGSVAWIVLGGLAVLGFLFVSYAVHTYNDLVTGRNNVYEKTGFVQTAYQRRADLLPKATQIVVRYARHEQTTFVETAQARASAAGSIKLTPEVLNDPAAFAKFQQAQGELQSFFSRLMAVSEDNPELKADRLFIDLQAQFEGTENRIKIERDNYNKAVTPYNNSVQYFPRNILAGMFGFRAMPWFEADEASQKAPDIGTILDK